MRMTMVARLAGWLLAAAALGPGASAVRAECVRGIPANDVLWIRAGPGSDFARVGSFGRSECGIEVFWSTCVDGWCQVQKGGRSGWSFADYLTASGPDAGTGPVDTGDDGALCQRSCKELWVMRNQIYKDNGYCFSTERARAYFGNDGCATTSPRFNRYDQQQIDTIKRCEEAKGC